MSEESRADRPALHSATERERQARSFGPVAAAYDRGRPSYPRESAAWLVGRESARVLEVGAGTGKLTEHLVALGHDVHATDPDEAMLAILRERVPGARATAAAAEDLPLPDRSVDVVVAAQAFHWFELSRALPEIARVLRPDGVIALVWNERDERIPWVRRLGALIGTQEQLREPELPLVESGLFGFVEERSFTQWQDINRESIVDLVASRSNVAVLGDEARAAKLAEVLAFYDDYGRGMDGMQLPYVTRCFRAGVIDNTPPPPPRDEAGAEASEGPDDDMLLIDFR